MNAQLVEAGGCAPPVVIDAAPVNVLTKAGRRALERAAKRERGNVCPTGYRSSAIEQPMLERLFAAGYITDLSAPRITEAGRAALARFGGAA